jgi:amino acid adenylation domain-containing protein
MLVHQFLEASARLTPDRTALVCGQQRLTYREIEVGANRLAHALRERGLERGDRVAIWLENSVEAVIAIFGALKAGGTFMVIPPGTKRDRLAMLLADAEPTVLVTDQQRGRQASDVLATTPSLHTIVWSDEAPTLPSVVVDSITWSDVSAYPPERPLPRAIDVDLAALIYTSGTTGEPKGVMSSHANMVAATVAVNAYLENTADDVILNLLPLAFSYGLYQVLIGFQVGARVVLEQGFGFPAQTMALLERECVTALPGVPTLFALLLQFPDLLRRDLPSLRYITNAAGPLPASHLTQLRAAFPRAQFFSMYGQTECKRISYLPPAELDRRPASVGVAIPNSEVYIVDENGRRLPPNQVGELVVRGAHVMRGYWRAPELTARRFRPGPLPGETVLHTGDLFRMDRDGFLYFVSRMDDIIKSRGEKVAPAEVESVACQLAGVAEAAVVGVSDPILGQAVYLAVVPMPGVALTEREVRAHCARALDEARRPKYVRIVEALPRTANGKVDKRRIGTEMATCAAS